MNLACKVTFGRIFLTCIIAITLLFPYNSFGIDTFHIFVNELIVIDIKYIVAGILFIIACITDLMDGFIAKKYDMVTYYGGVMDFIADKLLIDIVLIIIACQGLINALVVILIIGSDTVINTIKMSSNVESVHISKPLSLIRSFTLVFGIILTLFNNLPFELINIRVSDVLLIIASVVSAFNAVKFYEDNIGVLKVNES